MHRKHLRSQWSGIRRSGLAADGRNKAPFRRAARFDSVMPTHTAYAHDSFMSAEELRDIVEYVNDYRSASGKFDVVMEGQSTDAEELSKLVPAYALVGLTWWIESSVGGAVIAAQHLNECAMVPNDEPAIINLVIRLTRIKARRTIEHALSVACLSTDSCLTSSQSGRSSQDDQTPSNHAVELSGGCSSTRGRYSTSWMRPSKVRLSIISRATSG